MGRSKGLKCCPITISIPIPIFKLLNDDAHDPQQGYPTGNVSRVATTIFSTHYKKALEILVKKEKRNANTGRNCG
ncbi:MAG: hypothetical protein IMZ53_12775 [Thermoplasmata archaeon]|nr:hypothetical protein [Thermoplasmata archaeon]